MRARRASRLVVLLAMVLAVVAAGCDSHPDGFSLVWNDEFNDNQLDRAKWCTRYIYGGGPPLQVPDPACQRNGDGNLDFLNDEQQRYVDTNRNGQAMHVEAGGTLSLRPPGPGPTTVGPPTSRR